MIAQSVEVLNSEVSHESEPGSGVILENRVRGDKLVTTSVTKGFARVAGS